MSTLSLSVLVPLLGLWILLTFLWRDYCIDRFRQDMFALRDDLFDYASDGHVDFEHPAYGILRQTMNGLIQFAHRGGLASMVVSTYAMQAIPQERRTRYSFRATWERAARSLDHDQREVLTGYIREMNLLVIKHTVTNSPLVLMVLLPAVVLVLLRQGIDEIQNSVLARMSGPVSHIDTLAMELAA